MLTPREIVKELDKHIIGQVEAKKAVAVALRNRWRRKQLPPEVAAEIIPRNILFIGPTGVGKTEIGRRLAKLANAPFVKIEASKFTEVGYVGRNVESMVRDLVEAAVSMVREEERTRVRQAARSRAEREIVRQLGIRMGVSEDLLLERLRNGFLDEEEVDIEVETHSFPSFEMITPQGIEEIGINFKDLFPGIFGGGRKRSSTFKVKDALEILEREEADKMIDRQKIVQTALKRAQEEGIIFIDEIDKIAGRESGIGPDVSREGVQRDLLPIVEGTTVATKYGPVKTDHILFIAAGAFHVAKPSDLIPELQGRFPIRVELQSLRKEDFVRILLEPKASLVKQYKALMATEEVELEFTKGAIELIAEYAYEINKKSEDIGARRLLTVMEKICEELFFAAPEMKGVKVVIDENHVRYSLEKFVTAEDTSIYML